MNAIRTVRVKDLAKDPLTGEAIALAPSELQACACCAKLCTKVHVLSTGHEVGHECASVLEQLAAHGGDAEWARVLRASKKQRAFLEAIS